MCVCRNREIPSDIISPDSSGADPVVSHVNRCVRCWHFFLSSCLGSNRWIIQAFSNLLLSAHQPQNWPFSECRIPWPAYFLGLSVELRGKQVKMAESWAYLWSSWRKRNKTHVGLDKSIRTSDWFKAVTFCWLWFIIWKLAALLLWMRTDSV